MMKRWSNQSPGNKLQDRPLWYRFLHSNGRLRLHPEHSSLISHPSTCSRKSMCSRSRNPHYQPLIRVTRGQCRGNRHLTMETRVCRGNPRHLPGVGSNRSSHRSMHNLPVPASTGHWTSNRVRPGRLGVYQRPQPRSGRLHPTTACRAAVSGATVLIPTPGRTRATTVQHPTRVREATVPVGLASAPTAIPDSLGHVREPGSRMFCTEFIKKLSPFDGDREVADEERCSPRFSYWRQLQGRNLWHGCSVLFL